MGMQLSGSLELTGSLTTSGAIVAQTLVVQTITSSITQMTGSNIFGSSLTNRQQFTGSVTVTGSLAVNTTGTELQVNANGVNLGNALTDSHVVSGSFRVNPNGLFVSGSGFVGVGAVTSSIGSRMVVSGSIESLTDPGGEGGQLTLRGNTFQYAVDNFNGTGVRIIRENDGTGAAGVALMFVSGSGNVGIGTSNPANYFTTTLTIDGSSSQGIMFRASGADRGYVYQDGSFIQVGSNAGGVIFKSSDTERMRINSSGEVGIGMTASSGNRFMVRGSSISNADTTFAAQNSAGTTLFFLRNDGYINAGNTFNNTTSNAANVSISSSGFLERSTSSIKYKKDVIDYDKGLTEVMQMRPVYYKGKNPNDRDKQFAGLIAEEIDALGLNEFVTYADDGSPDALAYQNMIALLTKAIQELNAKVTALENR